MEGILAIFFIFGGLPLIVFIITLFRYLTRKRMAEVLQQYATLDKDPPSDLIESISLPRRQPHTDLKRGMIAIALGLALFILGAVIPDDEATVVFAGLAAFPVFVGIALLLFWYFVGRKTENV